MIKKISVVAVMALFVVGCGSTGSKSKVDSTTPTASTLSDAKALAENLGGGVVVANTFGKDAKSITSNSTKTRSVQSVPCDEGSMVMDFDENILKSGTMPTSFEVKMEMKNCKEGTSLSNGKMNMTIDNFTSENPNYLITFPTDFTGTDDGKSYKILKGGSMKATSNYPLSTVTINFEMQEGSKSYGGKNLIYKIQENSDGSIGYFPVSGQENFGTGYYTVDPDYDASVSPMLMDGQGAMQVGGLFKYLDGANHKTEVEITATKEITVRVDLNANGTFESDEVEVVKVK
jgi:hypothetical protein